MAITIQHFRTLRLKVRAEGYAWLNAVAIEVNQVWNFANATCYKASRPFAGSPTWLTAFDRAISCTGATESGIHGCEATSSALKARREHRHGNT